MTGRSSEVPGRLARRSGWPPKTAIVAATIGTASVVSLAIGLLTAPWSGPTAPPLAMVVATTLAVISPVTVGAILVTRLPRNPIGWLLVVSGLSLALNLGTSGLADYGLTLHPGSVPGAIWMAVLSNVTWVPLLVGLGFYLPLLYPSGQLPSPRWRPVALLGIVAIACSTVQNLLGPFPPGSFPPAVQNPMALVGPAADLVSLFGATSTLIGLVALPLAAASLAIRYRRASGVERAQLKWLAAVGAIVGVALVIGIATGSDTSGIGGVVAAAAWLIVLIGFGLLPVAIGIAVLRYRLYEIDRIVSRTIGYGALTAIVGGLFVGFILIFQAVLAPVTHSNDLSVAGSTLLVFSLFQPLRRRVQRTVDRRFNRARYDAERTVAGFAARLRDEVDLEQLGAEITATVARTVEPVSTSLWLRS